MQEIANLIVDKARGREKVDVHYHGDAQHLTDLTRHAFLFNDIEEYQGILPFLNQQPNIEVVAINDRIKVPADNHYRDLKILVRVKSNQYIGTFLYTHGSLLDCRRRALEPEAKMAAIEARARCEGNGGIVITFDNFNVWESDSRILIEGFPDFHSAEQYARLRFQDSFHYVGKHASIQENVLAWLALGEDTMALNLADTNEVYHAAINVVDHASLDVPEPETHWTTFEDRLNLRKSPLPFMGSNGTPQEEMSTWETL